MHRAILAVVLGLALAPSGSAFTVPSSRNAAVAKKKRVQSVITLERTICFGSCPVYKLAIYSNGRVLYQGIRFVKIKGKATGHIGRQALNDLIKEFTNIDYFKLDDEYVPGSNGCPQVATDLPGANTSLVLYGRRKSVRHYHGCSGASALALLTNLENKIDEAVNSAKWIK